MSNAWEDGEQGPGLTTGSPAEPVPAGGLSGRHRRRGWLILAAALALILAGLVAENLFAKMEMDSLLGATRSSEKAMHDFQAATQAPLPLDAHGNVDATAAFQVISTACGDGAANVQTARAFVEDVRTMPWRVALVDAQRRYLAHNEAWLDYLRGCATDAKRYVDKAAKANITSTFKVAGQAYLAALPLFASDGQRAQVASIFAGAQPST